MIINMDELIAIRIEELLLNLGFSPARVGMIYFREAIFATVKLPENKKLAVCPFYREYAIKHNTTTAAVEKSMRYSLDEAFCLNHSKFLETLPNLCKDFKRPKNTDFIHYCAYLIRQQVKNNPFQTSKSVLQ